MSPETAVEAEAQAGAQDEVRAAATAAWAGVLDDLEAMAAGSGGDADDDAVARLLAWTPPEGLGPLPPSLVERALDVVARLGGAVGSLHAAMASNRRHARALQSVPTVQDPAAAAYLDVRA
ncbi:hypothetical protein [Cellulosimicrobium cellulans]|uniref:hypothetical protein n=1 Tax=Cellulosimicrobium cellulans TaxID=1710 RepID=UPI0008484C3B|nr:hypothetical protein [Cellulosimicrobium cellulans]